jgi:hypothetical protein
MISKKKTNLSYLVIFSISLILFIVIVLFAKNVIHKKSTSENKINSSILTNDEAAKNVLQDNPDVTIIRNESIGIWDKEKKRKIEMIQNLTIGGDEHDENMIFDRVHWIVGGNEGKFFVFKDGNGKISKYDKNGKYLFSFSGKGDGPGEISGYSTVILDKKGILNIFDYGSQRISYFTRSGEFLHSFNLQIPIVSSPYGFTKDDSNFYYISCFNSKKETVIHKYNSKGELLKSFGKPVQMKEPLAFIDYSIKKSISKGSLIIGQNKLYYSQYNPYEIRQYSLDCIIEKIIFRKNSFMPPHKAEVVGFDKYKVRGAARTRIITIWNGMLINYVGVPKHIGGEVYIVLDFFNFAGQLLTSIFLKENIVFKSINENGTLYGVLYNENEYEKIVRYKFEIK